MRDFLRTGFLICVAIATFDACGRTNANESRQVTQTHQVLAGSLLEMVEKIQASRFAETCDHQSADQQRILAEALDARAKKLVDVAAARPAAAGWERIQVGTTHFLRRNTPAQPKEGWQTDIDSWAYAYDWYTEIRDQPDSAQWSGLNTYVRSLLSDDLDRVRTSWNVYLTKDSGAPLKRAYDEIKSCLENLGDGCREPLSAESRAWTEANPIYRELLTQTPPALRKLEEQMRMDYEFHYAFRKEPSVRRNSASELTVTLDSGAFAGAENELAELIESFWKSTHLRIKIDWNQRAANDPFFRFALGETVGDRAFVDFKDRRIQLFPEGRTTSIAHEFGHVLGFRDVYFTTWDPKTCEYKTESREDDLMSTASTGRILPSAWETLDREYPWQ